MAAAQHVVEELLGTCRQKALLSLRQSVLPATPIRSSRKAELIADLAAECDTVASRQRIFAEALATWSMHELRLFIARLRGLGYMVPVGQRPRQPDLIAAIVGAQEHAVKATGARGSSQSTRKGVCSSAGIAERLSPGANGTSQDPGSAVEPPSCTALVALESTAAPLKLQQKLSRRWAKRCATFIKKNDHKRKLKRVDDELRKAFQEHGAAATVGDLRAMVGQAVGLPLDGKYRLRFDRALFKLTNTPPKKRRAQSRFTIARGSRAESASGARARRGMLGARSYLLASEQPQS